MPAVISFLRGPQCSGRLAGCCPSPQTGSVGDKLPLGRAQGTTSPKGGHKNCPNLLGSLVSALRQCPGPHPPVVCKHLVTHSGVAQDHRTRTKGPARLLSEPCSPASLQNSYLGSYHEPPTPSWIFLPQPTTKTGKLHAGFSIHIQLEPRGLHPLTHSY